MSKIFIEGIDGCGKGTMCAELKKYLTVEGYNANIISYPTYSSTSSVVNNYLNSKTKTINNPYTISIAYALDRMMDYEKNSENWKRFNYNIFDRSYISNFFYHTIDMTDEEIIDYVKIMIGVETFGYTDQPPLVTFYLYHPLFRTNVDLLKKRRAIEKKQPDLHEGNLPYLKKVADNAWRVIDILNTIRSPENKRYFNIVPVACSDSYGRLYSPASIAATLWEYIQEAEYPHHKCHPHHHHGFNTPPIFEPNCPGMHRPKPPVGHKHHHHNVPDYDYPYEHHHPNKPNCRRCSKAGDMYDPMLCDHLTSCLECPFIPHMGGSPKYKITFGDMDIDGNNNHVVGTITGITRLNPYTYLDRNEDNLLEDNYDDEIDDGD